VAEIRRKIARRRRNWDTKTKAMIVKDLRASRLWSFALNIRLGRGNIYYLV